MKKQCFAVGVACAALLSVTGCSSLNTNDAAVPATVTINQSYTPDIQVRPTKVSGEATVKCLFGIFSWGPSKYADDAFVYTGSSMQFGFGAATWAKQSATYNACDAAKANYILAAQYEVETDDYIVYKKVKCKVTGYPGVLKGVKFVND